MTEDEVTQKLSEILRTLESEAKYVSNTDLLLEAINHFNEPVVYTPHVGRLIGYAETAIDCYWIIKGSDGTIFWHTCVGGVFWLDRLRGQGAVVSTKGILWDDLVRIDSDLRMNGCPKEQELIIKIDHTDHENSSLRKG